MRPLLVLLERLWGSLGAYLTGLGASWGALGRVLGALRELLGTSSAQETLYISKLSISPRWEHDFGNLSEQGTGSAYKKDREHTRRCFDDTVGPRNDMVYENQKTKMNQAYSNMKGRYLVTLYYVVMREQDFETMRLE